MRIGAGWLLNLTTTPSPQADDVQKEKLRAEPPLLARRGISLYGIIRIPKKKSFPGLPEYSYFFVYFLLLLLTQNPRMMKKWTFHFVFAFLFFPGGTIAFELYRTGARSAALGNASVALTGSESLFHNPAGLAGADQLSFVLCSESRFLMKEMSVLAAGMVIPFREGSAGLSQILFRAGVYRSGRTTAAFARPLGDRVSAAVAFDCLSERFPEQERASLALTAEAGLQVRCNAQWMAALWVFHPISFKPPDSGENHSIPTLFRGGAACRLNKTLNLLTEVEFSPGHSAVVKTGLEIIPHPQLVFRAGFSSLPLTISGGVGIKLGKTEIDISFYQQGALGFTPVAGFTFNP